MSFYGLFGIIYGIFLWLIVIWDFGGGYNDFN